MASFMLSERRIKTSIFSQTCCMAVPRIRDSVDVMPSDLRNELDYVDVIVICIPHPHILGFLALDTAQQLESQPTNLNVWGSNLTVLDVIKASTVVIYGRITTVSHSPCYETFLRP